MDTSDDPFEFHFNLTQDRGLRVDPTEDAINQSKEMSVICFSEVNDKILMWSHYTQGHAGFCIELERKENNDLGKWDLCAPVIYNPENKPLSFTPEEITKPESFTKIATSKSSHWAYEKEWRLIGHHEYADTLIPLPAPISCIIFGCKMGINEKKTIARILGSNMKYAEAKQMKSEFALKIE
ncbi:MAG: DUF2971 domain-containing protein [Chlorobiaceae bacterium]|nr:DUF2971 domain-containing protein [Chlorobiaceae bacterium]